MWQKRLSWMINHIMKQTTLTTMSRKIMVIRVMASWAYGLHTWSKRWYRCGNPLVANPTLWISGDGLMLRTSGAMDLPVWWAAIAEALRGTAVHPQRPGDVVVGAPIATAEPVVVAGLPA